MNTRQSETARIATELRKAIHGEAWHGPALLEVLADVSAPQATARPIPAAHSIVEIVLHVATWLDIVSERVGGQDREIPPEEDWQIAHSVGADDWERLRSRVAEAAERLARRIEQFPDAGLDELLPGAPAESSSAYATLQGSVQHVLYHAGQIAVLKKA